MKRILLQVSTENADAARAQVLAGVAPRREYLELADLLQADILDQSSVREHRGSRRVARFGPRGAGHAWRTKGLLGDYDAVFSDGEHIGLLLGAMIARRKNRFAHTMIGHRMSPWRKRILAPLAKDGIDALIVHASSQLQYAVQKLRYPPADVYLIPYYVDTDFWQPESSPPQRLIVSGGIEQRDYACLIDAVRNLPLSVTVAAMSHWSRDRNRIRGRVIPDNMTVSGYDYVQLRQLYAQSCFVVVSLRQTDFQAGITTILEAMAMGKAVIATRTDGQTDTVVGPLWGAGEDAWPNYGPPAGESTGIYVPVGDAEALRSAILYLLHRPELAAVMGNNGRRYVEQRANLELYVRRLASIIDPTFAEQFYELSDAGTR